ncbi:MAG: hypothetical protein IJZ25_03865 [Lachnospiraceae bacterium]|nr:hypothetical protein [Lachnospiraceae bacterium]
MKERLNVIHWILVADVILCLVFHQVALAQNDSGEVSVFVANILQISIYGALLFIMATFAGIAVYFWKKMEVDGSVQKEKPEYPKTSFIAALVATVIFSIYWMF